MNKASYKFARNTISTLLVASMLFLPFSGYKAYAADPVNHTEASNSKSFSAGGVSAKAYAASSIGFMGAEWSSARNSWAFNYKFVGTGATRQKNFDGSAWVGLNGIRTAVIEVKGTSNTSNMAMWTSTDTKYLGSYPESSGNTTPEYYNEALVVANFAITALNSLAASYAWSAYALVDYFRNTVDTSTNLGTHQRRQWNWSPDKADVGQYFWFIVDVKPSQTVQISTEYQLYGPGFELLSAGKTYRNLEAGAALSSLATSAKSLENWSPGMMSAEEIKQYGIEEIPRADFERRAEELNISQRSIDEFKSSDDKVFYYAHNFTEYEVQPSENVVTTTKEALIQEINTLLERSEDIILTFSNHESSSDDDQAIIQKHQKRQALLEDLLVRLQSVNNNDNKAIDILWKELQDDILKSE